MPLSSRMKVKCNLCVLSELALCCFVLALTFTLEGCGQGQSPASQHVQQHASPPVIHDAASPLRPSTTVKSKAPPVRLIIPAIAINAPIENVGITPSGDLATPARSPWDDAGWYNLGPHPGERGSSVIDGHLDRPGGYPAVFWNLRNIQVGNAIMVIDAQGKFLHFHVTGVMLYSPQVAPIQQIFGNESGTYLNLITCAGDWIPSQHQTTLRLVVYSSLD